MKTFAIVVVLLICTLSFSQDLGRGFVPLEFERQGISFEVPKGWYALNNGALKTIADMASSRIDLSDDDKAEFLLSLLSDKDVNNPNVSIITLQYSSESLLSQNEVANSSEAQKKVILDHWKGEGGFSRLKNFAYYANLIDDGDIIQVGQNWYARIAMEVQMRSDLPRKIKEAYYHMSKKGVIVIAFTYLPESRIDVQKIRDYVLESLRLNAIQRAQ